jgi:hypothetical protein
VEREGGQGRQGGGRGREFTAKRAAN